jgi:hypothetical protein
MGNSGAKIALCGAFFINMDPLVVASGFSELVDSLLVYSDVLGWP